jgi:hypothetical protein
MRLRILRLGLLVIVASCSSGKPSDRGLDASAPIRDGSSEPDARAHGMDSGTHPDARIEGMDAGRSESDAAIDAGHSHGGSGGHAASDAASSPDSLDATKVDASLADDGAGGEDAAVHDLAPWAPNPDNLPATGNYIYIESDVGDYIAEGHSYLYTQADSVIVRMVMGPADVAFSVEGEESWTGEFQTAPAGTLSAGFYEHAQGAPFYQPGIEWGGEGRGCNTVSGWLMIDHVVYANDKPAQVDLRFGQHCEGEEPELRGVIHWRADDPTSPPGPVNPPPADLWHAEPGATPASGNYIFQQYGNDTPTVFTAPTSTVQVGAYQNEPVAHLNVTIKEMLTSFNDFEAMVGFTKFVPGYYGSVHRYPFHNPARGGMSWLLDSASVCEFTGWFTIDHVVYTGTVITELDLRAEQTCEGYTTPFHVQIHYVAN